MEISFIHMQILVHFHVNTTNLIRLALKLRGKATRNLSIGLSVSKEATCCSYTRLCCIPYSGTCCSPEVLNKYVGESEANIRYRKALDIVITFVLINYHMWGTAHCCCCCCCCCCCLFVCVCVCVCFQSIVCLLTVSLNSTWMYLNIIAYKSLEESSTVWKFYLQNISSVFLEHFHTTENLSTLWNWTKLWKLDCPTFFFNISKYFHMIGEVQFCQWIQV